MDPTWRLSPKLMKRFYEPLVLLRVLAQVQGERVNGDGIEDTTVGDMTVAQTRREVMHQLCVMGDFLKGGDTVTAIALENLPQGPRYWLAANAQLEKIETFLTEVLGMLEAQASSMPHESAFSALEHRLFYKFVDFHHRRIRKYWKLLQPCIKQELQRIDSAREGDLRAEEYSTWLRAYQSPLSDHWSSCELTLLAYESRHSAFLRVAVDPLNARPTAFERDSTKAIRHLIGRLCAPKRAAVLLNRAAQHHPTLFEGFSLQCQSAGSMSATPIPHAGLTLEGLSSRMFSTPLAEQTQFLEALLSLDQKGSILPRVRDQYRDRNWRPRVHAELALLEVLSDRRVRFYDDDKYIACSKAACFCCYHYICAHQGTFVRPACHNKVYLNWKPPDLSTHTVARYAQQRDVMISLTTHIRRAVVDRVLRAQYGAKWHPDSTTGITASVMDSDSRATDNDYEGASNLNSSDGDRRSSQVSQQVSDSVTSESEDSEDGGVSLT